jgi:putative endonuclease
MKRPATYIMANQKNGTIYVGVTSNLSRRVYQHKNSVNPGFTSKYECKSLVYYELHSTMEEAIEREKNSKLALELKK